MWWLHIVSYSEIQAWMILPCIGVTVYRVVTNCHFDIFLWVINYFVYIFVICTRKVFQNGRQKWVSIFWAYLKRPLQQSFCRLVYEQDLWPQIMLSLAHRHRCVYRCTLLLVSELERYYRAKTEEMFVMIYDDYRNGDYSQVMEPK